MLGLPPRSLRRVPALNNILMSQPDFHQEPYAVTGSGVIERQRELTRLLRTLLKVDNTQAGVGWESALRRSIRNANSGLQDFLSDSMKHNQHRRSSWLRNAPTLRVAKRVVVAVIGGTVTLIGIALIVLPGPAFIVIPIGLSILATEFLWAKRWLQKARELATPGKSKRTRDV